ncbi:MAG: PPC domain-containing protein [Deltaproteobacteria bacterium]|nr:PPC domain-containing protein [Deltaproteobacteria bacterium]
MLRNGLLGIIVGLALTVGGCGGGGGGEQQDASAQHDVMQFDVNQSDQGGQDDAPVGDNNDSFEQAIQMDFTTASQKSGVINPAGDKDYYKFEGTAGDWITVFTEANAQCDGTNMDTVLVLYDSSKTQIAVNDNPSFTCDSYLTTRLAATGTYYVMIQDYSQYASTDPADWNGGPLFTYKIYLMKLTATTTGVVMDPETGNDLASAKSTTIPTDAYDTLIGTLASGTDIDVFTFSLSANTSVWIDFDPAGAEGNGSTSSLGQTYITDAAGTTVIARFDGTLGPGASELSPPLLPGDPTTPIGYALWVKAPSGSIGSNPFYTATLIGYTEDNTPEAEAATATGANDTLATAETLVPNAEGRAYTLLHLPDGDVDYLKMPVTAGDLFHVNCGSATSGSGVQGLKVSVRNENDAEVASCTEDFTDATIGCGIGWDTDVTVSATGFYYLKFTKTGQVADVTSNFVRCLIWSETP